VWNDKILSLILDHLLGSKVDFNNLRQSIEFISNLFYHLDSARRDMIILESDLRYYLQREWRIISGLKTSRGEFDRQLTPVEMRRLEGINSFFSDDVELKRGRLMRRSLTSRAITTYKGRPFWEACAAFTYHRRECQRLVRNSRGVVYRRCGSKK